MIDVLVGVLGVLQEDLDLVGHLMVNAATKQTSNDAYDAEGN